MLRWVIGMFDSLVPGVTWSATVRCCAVPYPALAPSRGEAVGSVAVAALRRQNRGLRWLP
jgi:hypothetical protein